MINFDMDFINAKGAFIKYNEFELIRIDRIPVNKAFSGYLRVISTNSEWRQCIRLKVNGQMFINGIKGQDFIVWADDAKENVSFYGISKGAPLIIWNAWESKIGSIDAWLIGAAMIVEIEGNVRRYRCNDGHPDDNFDDIIFEIVIDI
jgi:hypothetical protein